MANKCKECGCTCKRCISDHDVQLHVEIENLKQRLLEKETHIVTMETNFLNEANKFPSGELVAVREELLTWQDKYKRLYEAHRRVQRVNQGLEDKLLKLVDVCETEKNALTRDVATLSHKLAEANYAVKKLSEDNERYKNDVALAIQFLQCKQSNFVAHKFDSLSPEVQSQVSNFMTHKKKPEERKIVSEAKSIKVPIPTFPPTAMFYSVPKSPNPERKTVVDVEAPSVDIVSAAIMAKVLEERQKEKALTKHCDTCTCAKNLRIIYENTTHTIGTQTGDYSEMLCLKCNENIELTSVGMKIVRNDISNRSSSKSRETAECTTTTNNIVKVQPNNFLIDSKSLANSSQSSSKKLHNQNVSPKDNIINSNNHVISSELEIYQDVGFNHGNELELSIKKKYKMKEQQNDSMVPIKQTTLQKIELQESVDKTIMKNKDTNCCPVHLQTGAKNILLDNAHSDVASVLEIVKSDSLSLRIESESSKPTPLVYSSVQKLKSEEVAYVNDLSSNVESISSGNGRSISVSTETSVQNQQRVAEWIQSNLDNDVSSSDNSRADSVKSKNIGEVVDRAKYAEMEENVKRFLFGESEFLKKVEIGKLKYQSLQDAEPSNSKKKSCKTDF